MKEFKGTKGEWRYSEEYEIITISRPGIVESSKKICSLALPFDRINEETYANGKIIAAAPELLTSLIECLEGVEELNDEFQEGWDEVIERAKQVINKALGNDTKS